MTWCLAEIQTHHPPNNKDGIDKTETEKQREKEIEKEIDR